MSLARQKKLDCITACYKKDHRSLTALLKTVRLDKELLTAIEYTYSTSHEKDALTLIEAVINAQTRSEKLSVLDIIYSFFEAELRLGRMAALKKVYEDLYSEAMKHVSFSSFQSTVLNALGKQLPSMILNREIPLKRVRDILSFFESQSIETKFCRRGIEDIIRAEKLFCASEEDTERLSESESILSLLQEYGEPTEYSPIAVSEAYMASSLDSVDDLKRALQTGRTLNELKRPSMNIVKNAVISNALDSLDELLNYPELYESDVTKRVEIAEQSIAVSGIQTFRKLFDVGVFSGVPGEVLWSNVSRKKKILDQTEKVKLLLEKRIRFSKASYEAAQMLLYDANFEAFQLRFSDRRFNTSKFSLTNAIRNLRHHENFDELTKEIVAFLVKKEFQITGADLQRAATAAPKFSSFGTIVKTLEYGKRNKIDGTTLASLLVSKDLEELLAVDMTCEDLKIMLKPSGVQRKAARL